ncbi:MAG: CPBP family intramembrane glutamic endopeptidase [Planctomycetota bacterium]
MKPRSVFLGGIILEGVLVLIAVLVSYLSAGKLLLNPICFDLDGLGTGLAATLPMVAYFAFSLSRFGQNIASFQRIYDLLREILSRAIIELPTWKIVVLGMSAGIGEECLFRGVLQPVFEGWMPEVNTILTPQVNAILITGVIFGLLHALTPAYFIIATLLSIYFGFLVNYTGNLLTPLLAHGLYDVVGFLLLKRMFLQDLPPIAGPSEEDPAGKDDQGVEPGSGSGD